MTTVNNFPFTETGTFDTGIKAYNFTIPKGNLVTAEIKGDGYFKLALSYDDNAGQGDVSVTHFVGADGNDEELCSLWVYADPGTNYELSIKTEQATGIILSSSEMQLMPGRDGSLSVLWPQEVPDSDISWTSSNENVVGLDSNQGHDIFVYGLKEGTALVTAKVGESEATCAVTVAYPQITFPYDKDNGWIGEGQSDTYCFTAKAGDVINGTLQGEVMGPEDIATYDFVLTDEAGNVKANSSGTTSTPAQIEYSIPSTGTYYLTITNNSADVLFYQLSVTKASSSSATPPEIISQPQGASYAVNSVALPLTVTATGEGLSYQWYLSSLNSIAYGKPIAGALTAFYTPPTARVGDTYYYVIVKNDAGDITSDVAKITVNAAYVKETQTITCTSAFTKVYGNVSFTLGAKTSGDSTLSYKSGDSKVVTVNSSGKVTITGTGRTNIFITAPETGKYATAGKTVTVTVNPKQATGLKLKAGAKKLTASWAKDTKATGYQLVYAKNSKFTSGKKTITIAKYSTYKKTITKLTKGKNYYVKVRAYKTVGKAKLYGTYSVVKKVKVK